MTTISKALRDYQAGRAVGEPANRTERTALRGLIAAEFKALLTRKAEATGLTRNAIATDAVRRLAATGRGDAGANWGRNAFWLGRLTDAGQTRALAEAMGIPAGELEAHIRLAPWTLGHRAPAAAVATDASDAPNAVGADVDVAARPEGTDVAPVAADATTDVIHDGVGIDFTRVRGGGAGRREPETTDGLPLSSALLRRAERPRDLKTMADALEATAARLRADARELKKLRRRGIGRLR